MTKNMITVPEEWIRDLIEISEVGTMDEMYDYIQSAKDFLPCEYCRGAGEVSCDERDDVGNIQRGVGKQKCECKLVDNDE